MDHNDHNVHIDTDPGAKNRWVSSFKEDQKERLAKWDRLKDLDVLVMDNSVRESTVGQIKGHTALDKFKILEETRKCGFKEFIIGSLSNMTRVDDDFMNMLVSDSMSRSNGPDIVSGFWTFSEITDYQVSRNKIPNVDFLPVALEKVQKYGIHNVIFEIDLGNTIWDFDSFSLENFMTLLKDRFVWAHKNLPWNDHMDDECTRKKKEHYKGVKPPVRLAVNIRDIGDAMANAPERVYTMVEWLVSLPKHFNIFAIAFEEAVGDSLPETVGGWAKSIRQIIDKHNSKAHLIVHIHERYGLSDMAALQALMDGADGVWTSLVGEGVVVGHASACVTLVNLIRLGNTKILKKYKCQQLRHAAVEITKLTIGCEPHKRQVVYGPRALDVVFSSQMGPTKDFDLAEFFGEKAPVRMTTFASETMILRRLEELFGPDPQFDWNLAHAMRGQILDDLREGNKEEYMSHVGLALLMDKAGGKINSYMRDIIAQRDLNSAFGRQLIKEARDKWDALDDLEDEENQNDEMLEFDSFYNGFMAPFFSCYRCADTLDGLRCIDMDSDGHIDWSEFELYLKWAINQYPDDIQNLEQLLEVTFRKGVIPAMRDERERTVDPNSQSDVNSEYWCRITHKASQTALTVDPNTGSLTTTAFTGLDGQLFKMIQGGVLIAKSGRIIDVERSEDGKMTLITKKEKRADEASWRLEKGRTICNSYEVVMSGGKKKGDPVTLKRVDENDKYQLWTWTHMTV